MRPITLLIDPDNADGNGICASQTPAGAGSFVLDGALIVDGKWTTSDNLGRLLSFTSDGIDNDDTYTITGKDINGVSTTESLTGPNATTVYSVNYYTEVTDITTSGAGTGNITIGFLDDFCTKTIPLDARRGEAATISIESVTGTLDVTGQETISEIQDPSQTTNWYAVTALTNVAADTRAVITNHASGFRVISNSYTDTASAVLVVRQTGA